ncbi:hypothetical protein Sa4125_25420 [Aureimonas sp. SA4125]|uniref:hypothetical protein n=1 Tax=Aureimonas sp. SA4125 TaxID=2826993 RepID=UPI001CC7BB6C|nr:hypothetical protein [Aureimonas sp. SA4125]BDA85000.1 hypothetical protein Sa4125_25420 [Aureimonas sp. SA4125]
MADLLDATPAAPPALFEGPVMWVPEFLVDEVSPPPRESPDAWTVRNIQHETTIIVGESADETHSDEPSTRSFEPGDIVSFCSFQDFGPITVRIHDDGSVDTLTPVHPRASLFWAEGDPDTLSFSLEEFARNWAANTPQRQPDEPETGVVEHYTWSQPQPFVLTTTSDGPNFLRADADAVPATGAA